MHFMLKFSTKKPFIPLDTLCRAMMSSFICLEWHSGTWHGVFPPRSIPFKIWLAWFRTPPAPAPLLHITVVLTCYIIGGQLSAWTNLVVLLWPLLATRLFCPQTCHWLRASSFDCSNFFSSPFFFFAHVIIVTKLKPLWCMNFSGEFILNLDHQG